ncbi:MAG: hypothetical protein CL424_14785 [Acidimicrobiaceae bacterium]|nr:hypothetical protein [Acidimicrobiaceae bacterium]
MTTSDDTHLPRVSVVITTRNRPQALAAAVESALALDTSCFELDLIVVDDGSTDETPEVLERYPVRVIRTEGVGMACARTIGLDAATGDYFSLLDDDDVWLPTAISTQLRVFSEHPEFAAVHAQAVLTGPDLEPFGDPFPAGPLESGMIFDRLLTYFPQVGTILTRMEHAREAGAFDGSLPGDNDWDWILRIASRYPIGAVEVPVMMFRQRDEPQEDLAWRRFPAISEIFRRHTAPLPLADRVRLQPALWRHRGWCASIFLNHTQDNWRQGERRRAARSAVYAVRCSPVHAVVETARRVKARAVSSDGNART